MEDRGYFNPVVTVKKKKKFALTKQQGILQLAKSMHAACTVNGKGCRHFNQCRFGWLCAEIHKENLTAGHLDKVQVTPVLTRITMLALLHFSSDVGAAELFSNYTTYASNPRRSPTKYNSLIVATGINVSTKKTAGIRKIKEYMETLV